MIRGANDAQTCSLNGWAVGTLLVGDEGYGPTVLRITAIGEESLLAVCESPTMASRAPTSRSPAGRWHVENGNGLTGNRSKTRSSDD